MNDTSYEYENLAKAAEALEQRIRPGDRVCLEAGKVGVIEGPSPVWWRARLPDGSTYDFDCHNDPAWIEHQGRKPYDEVETLLRIIERYRAFVQEPEIIEEIESLPVGDA
jgi:hypothetical protein